MLLQVKGNIVLVLSDKYDFLPKACAIPAS
jgi:hypothetical protein